MNEFMESIAKREKSRNERLSYFLAKDEMEEYKKLRTMMWNGVYDLSPYRVLPDEGHKSQNFLLGEPKSTSNMNHDDMRSVLEKAKERPWDIFTIFKRDNGDCEFLMPNYQVVSVRVGNEKGNFMHFEPLNIDDPEELKKYLDGRIPVTHPMYIWVKGTEALIFAVDNKLIKLTSPGLITAKTNSTHGEFLKHWGFKESNENYTVDFKLLRDRFKFMTKNDKATQRIIDSGQKIYKDAVFNIQNYLNSSASNTGTIDFWKWYYTIK